MKIVLKPDQGVSVNVSEQGIEIEGEPVAVHQLWRTFGDQVVDIRARFRAVSTASAGRLLDRVEEELKEGKDGVEYLDRARAVLEGSHVFR